MEKRIVITDDLAYLLLTLAMKEGYCSYDTTYGNFYKFQEKFLIDRLENEGKKIPNLFSRLSQLLLLYEDIDIPAPGNSYHLCGNITSVAHITGEIPKWFYESFPAPFKRDVLPNELALTLKPLVINDCMNKNLHRFFKELAAKTTGSVKSLFSYVYDWLYNNNTFIRNDYVDSLLDIIPSIINKRTPDEITHDQKNIIWIYREIQKSIFYLLLIQNIAHQTPCDFYTPAFSNYYTTTNANDAYCILKNQISMILDEQPAFETLTEILRFRDRKYRDIKLLRDEISTLDSLLVQGEREKAIQKAINDVRSANQSLIKNTVAKKTAKIATYLSVPISFLEMYTFGTSYSMAIGVVGTTAQLIADYNDSKSNWLFVAR